MPVFKTVVRGTWTYEFWAKNKDEAYETTAMDVHKCTLLNMDDGTFVIEEPVEEKMKFLHGLKLLLKPYISLRKNKIMKEK